MSKGILGRKVGMTQVFHPETGVATPVTVIEARPNRIAQVKTAELDGYRALQVTFGSKRASLVNQPGFNQVVWQNLWPIHRTAHGVCPVSPPMMAVPSSVSMISSASERSDKENVCVCCVDMSTVNTSSSRVAVTTPMKSSEHRRQCCLWQALS